MLEHGVSKSRGFAKIAEALAPDDERELAAAE